MNTPKQLRARRLRDFLCVSLLLLTGCASHPARMLPIERERVADLKAQHAETPDPYLQLAVEALESGRRDPAPILVRAEAESHSLYLVILDMTHDILGMRFIVSGEDESTGVVYDRSFTYGEARENLRGVALTQIQIFFILDGGGADFSATRREDGALRVWPGKGNSRFRLQIYDAAGNFSNEVPLLLGQLRAATAGGSDLAPGEGLPEGWDSEQRLVKIAASGGEKTKNLFLFRDSIGMEFVRIPGGAYLMGSRLNAVSARQRWPDAPHLVGFAPRRLVRITQPVFMATKEVTAGHFQRFVLETDYVTDAEREDNGAVSWTGDAWEKRQQFNWRNPGYEQGPGDPVVCVSWNDANAFCRWLSRKTGLEYRLPTEAEWEYACRAGSCTVWFWGNEEVEARACANIAGREMPAEQGLRFAGISDGYRFTAPVGQFKPNAWGLSDMIGNVWEWCEDRFGTWQHEDYFRVKSVENPTGSSLGEDRVLRGGSFLSPPWQCRASSRAKSLPEDSNGLTGFRVVCDSLR